MYQGTLHRFACVAVCVGFLAPHALFAQAPQFQNGEVQAVARVSKGLIEEVANREIAARLPYSAKILGLYFHGTAEGTAKPSVEIRTADDDATFVINAAGDGFTWGRGVRGPMVVTGPAYLRFATTTRVAFDGRKFSRLDTTPCVDVDFDLQKIEGRHGRLPGRIAGRLAMPIARRLVPRGECQAEAVGEYELKNFVDEMADAILGVLNRTAPVEASLNRVYPKTQDWVFQVSKTATYLQAAYGPPDSKVPALPKNSLRVEGNVWLELWLRSTPEEAQVIRELGTSPLTRSLLKKYLEATVPDLAAIAADWTVAAADSWVVISVRPEVPKNISLDSLRAPHQVRIGESAK